MTPRSTFYPKLETNFTDFHTVDLQFCPTYKMALWSPKRCMFMDMNKITKINKCSILSAKIFVTDILQFIRQPTKWDSCQSQTENHLNLRLWINWFIKSNSVISRPNISAISASQTTELSSQFHCLSHGLTVGSSFLMVLQILSGCSLKLTIT